MRLRKLLHTVLFAILVHRISAIQNFVIFVASHPGGLVVFLGLTTTIEFAQAVRVRITVSVKHVTAIDCWSKQRMAECCAKPAMRKARFHAPCVSNLCLLAEVNSARLVIGAGC